MPEISVTPTPTALPGAGSGASALAAGDGAVRGTEGATTSADGGTPTPFAATLKSHIEGGRASADGSASPAAPAQQAAADENSVPVDLSAILSLLGIDPATLAGIAPTAGPAPARTATTSEDPAAATPAVTLTSAETILAAPVAVVPVGHPAATAATAPVEPESRARGGDAAAPGRIDAGPAQPGKIVPEAAITADAPAQKASAQAELPTDDFRALMDRAVAMPAAPVVTGSAGTPHAASLRVDTPLGQAGWHDEVGQRLTWMVGNDSHRADLVLNPPDLGRVEVSLSVSGDKASAVFASPNPAVREALEASMDRLREVLADAGVTLGQTHVGSETPGRSVFEERRELARDDRATLTPPPAPLPGRSAAAAAGRGMIDVFA